MKTRNFAAFAALAFLGQTGLIILEAKYPHNWLNEVIGVAPYLFIMFLQIYFGWKVLVKTLAQEDELLWSVIGLMFCFIPIAHILHPEKVATSCHLAILGVILYSALWWALPKN